MVDMVEIERVVTSTRGLIDLHQSSSEFNLELNMLASQVTTLIDSK